MTHVQSGEQPKEKRKKKTDLFICLMTSCIDSTKTCSWATLSFIMHKMCNKKKFLVKCIYIYIYIFASVCKYTRRTYTHIKILRVELWMTDVPPPFISSLSLSLHLSLFATFFLSFFLFSLLYHVLYSTSKNTFKNDEQDEFSIFFIRPDCSFNRRIITGLAIER